MRFDDPIASAMGRPHAPRFAVQVLGRPSPSERAALDARYDTRLHPLHREAHPHLASGHRGDVLQRHAHHADLFLAYPEAPLFDLISLASEGEVYHPMMQHSPSRERSRRVKDEERLHRMRTRDGEPVDPHHNLHIKPLVTIGGEAEWRKLREIFAPIAEQGMLRDAIDQFFPRFDSVAAAEGYLASRLAEVKPGQETARAHRGVRLQQEVQCPVSQVMAESPPQRRAPIAAFFGSATTTRPDALAEAATMVDFCIDRGLDIIHGGGSAGVMGALTDAANRPFLVAPGESDRRPFVHGITAHPAGAHALYATEGIGRGLSRLTQARDMNQRIKLFESAHCFGVLRGGIGSVQEILQVAEDKASRDPRLSFVDAHGERVAKPLVVYSPDGLYDGLSDYLAMHEPHLRDEIVFVPTLEAMRGHFASFLGQHPPSPREIDDSRAERVLAAIAAERGCWAAEAKRRPVHRDIARS